MHAFSSYSSFQKPSIPSSQHLFSNCHLEFSAPGRKIVKFMGAWCSRRRLSQWLDYLLPPQRLCVPGEAFTITTKKSAIPSTGPLHSDNVSAPPHILCSQCSKVHHRQHSAVVLNQISLLCITNNPQHLYVSWRLLYLRRVICTSMRSNLVLALLNWTSLLHNYSTSQNKTLI
jgi:hypothetical protein